VSAFASVKLRPTVTVAREASAASFESNRTLVQQWCEEEGIALDSAEFAERRATFFATSLDDGLLAMPAGSVIPFATLQLERKDVETLVSLWGHARSLSRLNPVVAKIADFVDRRIAEFGGRAFVKLGSRSPKDVTWTHPRTLGAVQPPVTLEKLYRAQIDCMAVDSFDAAAELLMQSTRVLFDLQLDLAGPDTHTSIVVRPWLDIPLSCEWRGFVFGRKLRALSQYFCDLCFPDINRDVGGAIAEFFALLAPVLPVDDCIADFVVLRDGRVLLLELNQWATTTGSGCFDWSVDEQILKHSSALVVRVVEEQPVVTNLPAEWKAMLPVEEERL
jgi:hypothetical protein